MIGVIHGSNAVAPLKRASGWLGGGSLGVIHGSNAVAPLIQGYSGSAGGPGIM